jgi:predicted amidohydrolase
VKPLAIKENLQKIAHWCEKARREYQPELIVLPESITTGFSPGIPKSEFLPMIEPLDGSEALSFTQKLCQQVNSDILLPLYEREGEHIYNSAAYIDRHGKLLGVYRKTHLFPTEDAENGGWSTPGDQIVTVDTAFGRVGLIICYDGDFPELSRILALRGAKMILRPSALLRSFEIWDLTNRARAYDNHVHVVGVNASGYDGGGVVYFGHSMIVSPTANKLALARIGDEIAFAALDLDNPDPVSYGTNVPRVFDHRKNRNYPSYTEELLQEYKG